MNELPILKHLQTSFDMKLYNYFATIILLLFFPRILYHTCYFPFRRSYWLFYFIFYNNDNNMQQECSINEFKNSTILIFAVIIPEEMVKSFNLFNEHCTVHI